MPGLPLARRSRRSRSSTCSTRRRRIRASGELVDLADDAPTLHLYVVDLESECEHDDWRDPLSDEWCEVVEVPGPHARQ